MYAFCAASEGSSLFTFYRCDEWKLRGKSMQELLQISAYVSLASVSIRKKDSSVIRLFLSPALVRAPLRHRVARCQHFNASHASSDSVPNVCLQAQLKKDTIMANSNFPQGWFYIQSNLTDSIGRTCVANVEAANASPGAQIILWPFQPNAYNTLWQFNSNPDNTGYGTITTALGTQDLVLDTWYEAPNTWVVLNSPNKNSSSQQWTFDPSTGTFSNQDGLVLDIAGGSAQSGAWLSMDASAQKSSQQWSLVSPQVFMPTWSYIQSGLTEHQKKPLVVTIQEGTSNVVLSSVQRNSSNQLWQITPDGRILSATEGNPVITLGPQLGEGQNGNYLVTAPSPAQTDSTLQWIFNDQNMFINASNGLALNVEGSSTNENTPLITYAVQSGPPENEVWLISPASPLTNIMAMPHVGFRDFTGDQETAYTSICKYFKVKNLRHEYPNLSVDIGATYLTPLESGKVTCPPPPQGVNLADWIADWSSVVDQLTKELTAATDIRALFTQYNSFHGLLFPDQSSTLANLIADVGLSTGSDSPNVGGIILSVFEGVLYTALEALPGPAAVLGNVIAEGINIGMSVANSSGGSISPDPFQVAASDLQKQLNGSFEALLTTIGNMEEAILKDWGKMKATHKAIRSTGPDSLAWPANLTGNLVNAAKPGYTISVMQMLLPTKYQIFQYQANDDSAVSGPDSIAQWVQSIGNNTWNKYWIATPGNMNEYPTDQAMQDVWDAGVTESDFFQGLAGWGFARSYPFHPQTASSPGVGDAGFVITITNQTPNPLTVNASPNDGQGITVNGPSSQTLQPYGSVTFIGYYTGAGLSSNLAIDIDITDPNLAGADSAAKFTAHRNDSVTVDSIVIGMGYQLTSPICNSGVQIGICLAPINAQSSN
jgi:hypothetical protein